ncbi:MAG: phosphoribosylformylglycinamidine synthase [Eubacteriales bacterium]|nr:phosphoribosylformylglycinamidine synthase [Eubacteriales bacterium]
MSKVYRVYVEKRQGFDVEANDILKTLREQCEVKGLNKVHLLNRYDVQYVDEEILNKGISTILSEPMVDDVYLEEYPVGDNTVFAIEYLPGQYDQRADACEQCFQLMTGDQNVKVKCAKVYVLEGEVTSDEIDRIKAFLINPVDQRLASLEKPEDLKDITSEVGSVPVIDGFINFSDEELKAFVKDWGMAMNFDDLKVSQLYFRDEEHRDPTETELKVLDTYWSDHCRHTTFSTIIDGINIEDGEFKEILEKDIENYKASRHLVYGIDTNRPLTLMDLATISVKELRKAGYLDDLEVSKEINACSVEVKVHTDKGDEDWLLMFKNETHNHPTEIEPFGGAATCLGGAIRDPLSGRAYVYQSMRISGAADPRKSLKDTLKGKLPQRKICREAAHGFSSYGNQIGLTTGYVHEIYDEGYVAKRMELGAVVAAAPKSQVKRLEPLCGHVVLLIGGRTGRDGVGGATGSSKSHELSTTTTAGAEVQKGNPVEERKIQRLFRNPLVSEKIVRCNDFGAGGVCVAVGELADGLEINLDAVLKKYEGLTGTELAISESQERMAIVIDQKDEEFIVEACKKENLEVVRVAEVTDAKRLVMHFNGQKIVDISRDFLDKNGADRHQVVELTLPDFENKPFAPNAKENFKENVDAVLSSLSVCSQKGLSERFDSSIGNATVLSPFGGKTLSTETEGMCALLPVLGKETTTCSMMAYGYNPLISKWSPYHGSMYAVVESLSKIVAMGGNYKSVRFTFQEFFEKLLNDPKRWGKPYSSLLGAYHAQSGLKLASIGGKDSMSGSFEDLDVPPTLVSFAVTAEDVSHVITPELKAAGHSLYEFVMPKDKYEVYDFEALMEAYDDILALMRNGKVLSAYTVKDGGLIETIFKMAFGNRIGVEFVDALTMDELLHKSIGNIVVEVEDETFINSKYARKVAFTNETKSVRYKTESYELDEAYEVYAKPLDRIYPATENSFSGQARVEDCNKRPKLHASKVYDEVLVTIPVFPGTNCEYDSKRSFEKAGAKVNLVLIRNKTAQDIIDSVNELEASIRKSQIVMLPGGFSAGDEPEGSGKFIATVLRNEKIKAAIDDLLDNREGLMIGICNGFQALIKLGLLPDGHIRAMDENDATLTFNKIGRHLSQMVDTRIASVNSPWLQNVNVGDIHTVPISHGEGRFVAPKEVIDRLFANGQVITQYVDPNGNPTMESPYNPNGSVEAIEGIVSIDGRVLGKMAHSERQGENRNLNIYGDMDQKLFESGVQYFK